MMNDAQKRAKLVTNRKEIADEAAKLADQTKSDFIIEAGLAAGLGASLTSAFNYFGGSPQAMVVGTSILVIGSGATIIGSHLTSTFSKELYTKMSKQAKREAFEFDQDGDIEGQKCLLFEEYENFFREYYKEKQKRSVKTLVTARSALLAVGLGASLAFALMQESEENLRKEEDPQDLMDQGSYRVLVLGN